MDVTCERCSTAYEFDDALVSERGTTVKCTNCGHQFKVRRAEPAGAPERWVVRTIDGRELEFKALREMQTAIAQSLISREDVLSRGGSRPRRLGSIAELEPFFTAANTTVQTALGLGNPPPRQRMPTPQGLGAVNFTPPRPDRPTEGSIAIPLPVREASLNGLDDETQVMSGPLPARPAPPPPRPSTPSVPPPPPPRRSVPPPAPPRPGVAVAPQVQPARAERTLPVPLDDALPPPARLPSVEIAQAPQYEAPTAPMPRPAASPAAFAQTVAAADSDLLPAPTPPPSFPSYPRSGSIPPPTPSGGRASLYNEETYGEPRFSTIAPPRRTGAARWIVGFVIGGMLALAFATVGRRYLNNGPAPAAPVADARIATLLQDGEKSLSDGDLEGAQEQFAKASVLAERDPKVAADAARLAAVRGDVAWLRVRLLPDGDPDLGTAKRELDQAADRAKKAAALATELAPADPQAVRARIDALRLGGDLEGARKLVGGISAQSSQPDNALALAELDLADQKPDWPTIIARLRTALTGDQNLGRARSMLVYALARSGDVAAAKAELDRLSALPRPHPLVRPIRAFVNRADGAAPEASATSSAGRVAKGAPTGAAPVAGGGNNGRAPDVIPPPRPRDEPPPVAGGVDTSDLPGIKAPPKAADPPPTPPSDLPPKPASTVPPGVDTSDLPGFK